MSLVLVTSNVDKWAEAQRILGRPLERVSLELPELQAATTAEVAREKARVAFERLQRPVVVEDAGLELTALGGFPGPFIKFWEQLGGLASICRALDTQADRSATAVCALGIADASGVRVVQGRLAGEISSAPRGAGGFGWDAIFLPGGGGGRTFGELRPDEKDAISHRRLAWDALRARSG